jgi:HK97 family phage portal protein
VSPFLYAMASLFRRSEPPRAAAPSAPRATRRSLDGADAPVDADEILDAIESGGGYVKLVSAEKDIVSALSAESARLTGEGMRPAEQHDYLVMSACSLWAMVAIGAIASNLAGVPLRATRKSRKDGGKVEDAPDSALQELLDNPSDGTDGTDLVEQFTLYLESVGSTFCAVVREDAQSLSETQGEPIGLSVLRPTRVEIVPGGDWISAFKYQLSATEQTVPAANMIYARYFHVLNDFWGLPRMNAIVEAVASDKNLVTYNSRVLERHGVPTVVLETDQPIAREVRRRVIREWDEKHGRADRAGGAVVSDRGMKAKPFGISPKDMEFKDLARITKRRIFGAFGVPPAIAMDFDEASELANARSQRQIFYENTLQPKSRKITGPFSRFARLEFGPEWGVRMAWEEVDMVREEDLLERKEAREDFRAGIITRGEARKASNHEPLGDDRDDEFAQAPTPFGGPPVMEPDPPAEPPPKKDAEPAAETKATVPESAPSATAPLDAEAKARVQATAEMRRLVKATSARRYKRWLPKTKGVVVSFFDDQAERVLARVRAMLGDGDKALGDGEPQDVQKLNVSPDDLLAGIFNTRAEADAFRKKVGPVFLAGFVDAGQAKLEDLLAEEIVHAFQEGHARVTAAIDEWTASRVVGITEETERGLKEVIRAQYQEGANSRAMQDAIADYFREMSVGAAGSGDVDTRVERIARTETATFLNAGGYEADQQIEDAGGKVVKSWLSIRDELVRESHVTADDETRDTPLPLKSTFSNGLRFPNEPGAPADEVINCRCVLVEEVLAPPKVT